METPKTHSGLGSHTYLKLGGEQAAVRPPDQLVEQKQEAAVRPPDQQVEQKQEAAVRPPDQQVGV